MNPRYRRLLIPGLLVALLVIVVVSSLASRADGATADPEVVSRISDPRVTESSGLVVSRDDDDLAYTVNDSGNEAIVFAIRISTGETVGATTMSGGPYVDIEALAIDSAGTLWVADTGDNRGVRSDVALYAFPEQGTGDHTVQPTGYPLVYPEGPRDVEALAIDPLDDRKILITKGLLGGSVYTVPDGLAAGRPNEVTDVGPSVPGVITDAAFTIDGEYVIARDYSQAFVLDSATWEQLDTVPLPDVQQGETLAMEPDGRSFLVGSEGENSPLIRMVYAAPEPPEPTPSPNAADQAPPPGGNGFAGATWLWAALVVALLGFISAAAVRRR